VSPSPFERFCAAVGLALEPFQHEITEEVFGDRRELLCLLPRGNGKSSLLAAVALFHLLTTPAPAAYVCAASREQASVLFDIARTMAMSDPSIERRVEITRREIRTPAGFLRVISSDAPRQHGLIPSLAVIDELHAHPNDELLIAMATAMLKRPGARLVTISTAGTGPESALGRLRARALALPSVERQGAVTRAYGPNFSMLEWSVPDDADVEDVSVVKEANPASWITEKALGEQREAVPELAYRRFHANQWVARIGSWLPPGAWQRCAGTPEFEDGERIWIGVDIGGSRADSAVVWINEKMHVGCEIFTGEDAVTDVAEFVPELAERYAIQEAIFDPWRAGQMAREWEQRGVEAVAFPQSDARMIPASQALYDVVVEQRLVHPNDPRLNAHVNAAVARHGRRGWRIDKAERGGNIDGVVALCMAVERAALRPEPVELIGWL
jgi:phage terminase large subunit-like protein